MKVHISGAAWLLCISMLFVCCSGDAVDKKAGELLEKAQAQFENGKYAAALETIDSLRKSCPDAIGARRTALRLYQEIELRRAKINAEVADSALRAVESEYNEMKRKVEELKAKGENTAERLSALTRMGLKRDSLKTVFDIECAKIKYINRKKKE